MLGHFIEVSGLFSPGVFLGFNTACLLHRASAVLRVDASRPPGKPGSKIGRAPKDHVMVRHVSTRHGGDDDDCFGCFLHAGAPARRA